MDTGSEFRVLELFSGIGGMHYAFKHSGLPGEIIVAMDINTVANCVYSHNYPQTTVLNNNIQKLSMERVNKMGINTILMSPPCQPFTRVGLKKDIGDRRTDALKHICDMIPRLDKVEFILMENVKGFETSSARDIFVESLQRAGFYYREFLLSPTQVGVPNTRYRYYCLARRRRDFPFNKVPIWDSLPCSEVSEKPYSIREIVESEENIPAEAFLSDKVLGTRVWLMDIVTPDDINSICFTKAYTHYSEGTGSVYSPFCRTEVSTAFKKAKLLPPDSEEYLAMLRPLRLRYFTPKEVAKLMSFPDSFQFPGETTNRQRYRLLGNSINVKVVGELIKILGM